jgi:threonine dehydrogenase-like Zn-dependent dehydrogenase
VPGLEAEVAGQPAAPGIEDVEVDAGLAQHRLIRVVALDKLIEVVRATGRIGVVGVYNPQDPGAATEGAQQGRYGFNYGLVFDKAISMGHGQCPVKRYNHQLRDLPGFRNWQNDEHVRQIAQAWNVDILQIPHWAPPTHAMEIFRQIKAGTIRFLWVTATNPLVSLPELARIRSVCEQEWLFLVVSDAFLTETA